MVTRMERKPRSRRPAEEGYILITLMLMVALLAMSLVTLLPELAFQIKRDREEEMVHRGVQYSRAVRRYYRKFGGYPPSIDLLESSNNIRFLRKRYKDPITGEEFRILHMTDVRLSFGPGIAGGQTLGKPIAGIAGTLNANASTPGNGNGAPGVTPPYASADPSQQAANNDSTSNSPFITASGQPAGQTFGGGPIVGVASTSTKESIRLYNKKNHYNDWQFVYDPTSDRGGLLTGPYQPSLQTVLPGQTGQQGNASGLGGMNSGTNQGFIPGMPSPVTQPNPGAH